MTSETSMYTGNTSYTSDDGRFSSMSKRAVKCWDETMIDKEIETKADLIFWQCGGCLNFPIDEKRFYKEPNDGVKFKHPWKFKPLSE